MSILRYSEILSVNQPRLAILYEDNHLIAALKPPGILAQADGSAHADMLSLLKVDIKLRYQKPGEVYLALLHRLDQPVSGVMLFAKTSKAAARLSESLKKRAWGKVYYAICHGSISPESGSWRDRLSKEKTAGRYTMDPQGKEAILHYEQLQCREGLSLVKIHLETGRAHQIRLQFSARQHPLVGDRRYGWGRDLDRLAPAPALLAATLEVEHPVRKECLHIEAPWPSQEPFSRFKDPRRN